MSGPLIANTRTPRVRPVPKKILYVRPGGSDSAQGTLGAPLATLEGAWDRIPSVFDDAHYVLDLTGYSRTTNEPFYFSPKVSSMPVDLQFAGGQFLQDVSLAPINIVAAPSTYATLAVLSQNADATTTLLTINTSQSYTLNELRGKFVRGSVVGEWGVVAGNTAGPNSTVFVTTVYPFTAPVEVLDTTCELRLGDSADAFNRTGVYDMPCPVAITGVKLSNLNAAQGMAMWIGGTQFFFEMCEIQGLYSERGMSRFDACYFNGGLLSANGHANAIYQSYLKNVNIEYHGEGGVGGQLYSMSVAEGCTPLGHWNNFQSGGGVDVGECEIISPKAGGSPAGAATIGVYYRGGSHSRVRNTKIGGATRAILCEGPGYLLAQNVQNGAVANTDVGCELQEGAHVLATGGTAVSGNAGQVRLGSNLINWANAPATDTVQLVRLA